MHLNVARHFDDAVESFPFNVAVKSEKGDMTLTYEALRDKVSLISQCLRGYNHVSSSLVAIQMHRGAGIVVAMLGALKAELVYVPIDPNHPIDRQKYIMNHSKCQKLITDRDNYSQICEYNQSYEQIIILDFDDGSIVDVFEGKSAKPESILCIEINAAYVLYTSGSTGRPKGVVVKNCSLANTVLYFAELLRAGPGDVVLALTTFCFDISMLEIYIPLTTGATVVVGTSATQRNPSRLGSLISSHGVTIMQGTPSLFTQLHNSGWLGDSNLQLIVGGEAFRSSLLPLVKLCRRVINAYGPTETTIWSSCYELTYLDMDRRDAVPIGKPISHTSFYLLCPGGDVISLDSCDPNDEGELLIGGRGVSLGYLHDIEQTRHKFRQHILRGENSSEVFLYHTGDRVRVLPCGNCSFLGRVDDQIKVGGFRVEPGEIEAVLLKCTAPEISAAAVFLYRDREMIAVVSLKDSHGHTVDTERMAAMIVAFASSQLPYYTVPHRVIVSNAPLPVNANGKVNKALLKEGQYDHLTHEKEQEEEECVFEQNMRNESVDGEKSMLFVIRSLLGAHWGENDRTLNTCALGRLPFRSVGIDSFSAVQFQQALQAYLNDPSLNIIDDLYNPSVTIADFAVKLYRHMEATKPSILQKLRITSSIDKNEYEVKDYLNRGAVSVGMMNPNKKKKNHKETNSKVLGFTFLALAFCIGRLLHSSNISIFVIFVLEVMLWAIFASYLMIHYRFQVISWAHNHKDSSKLINMLLGAVVSFLGVWKKSFTTVVFKHYYSLSVRDDFSSLENARATPSTPTIFISPHHYGSYDRCLIQHLAPNCKVIAVVGFEPYGNLVEGAIPVVSKPTRSDQNDEYFTAAIDHLRAGGSVWFSPEGTNTRTPDLGALSSGFARVALLSGIAVNIVPCWWQFEHLYRYRSKIVVEFDEALKLKPVVERSFSRVIINPDSISCFHFMQRQLNLFQTMESKLRRLASFEVGCWSGDNIGFGRVVGTFSPRESVERWVYLRALEAWSGAGSLPLLERLKHLQHCCSLNIPVPDYVVADIEDLLASIDAPKPNISAWFPSPIGLSASLVGRELSARSWHWFATLADTGHASIENISRNAPVHRSELFVQCTACGENVPRVGVPRGKRKEDLYCYHFYAGGTSARELAKGWRARSPCSHADGVIAIVPCAQSCGTLHALFLTSSLDSSSKDTLDRSAVRILARAFPIESFPRSSTVWLPCPQDATDLVVNTLQTEMIAASENGDIAVRTLDGVIQVCQAIANIPTLESMYRKLLGGDLRTGEAVVQVVGYRAFDAYLKCRKVHPSSVMMDLGGNDGFRTLGVAACMGFSLRNSVIWEVVDQDAIQIHPIRALIKRLVHSEQSPFVDIRSGHTQAPSSVGIALAFQCLHHVTNMEALRILLAALGRIMVPGGLLIVKEHDVDVDSQGLLRDYINHIHSVKDSSGHPMTPPSMLLSRSQWRDLFQSFGFIRLEPYGGDVLTCQSQDGDPANMLSDPMAHSYATFIDVYEFKGLGEEAVVDFSVKRIPRIKHPLWIDRRNNAWRPAVLPHHIYGESPRDGLEQYSGTVGFCIPKGKWDNLVRYWFDKEPNVHFIDSENPKPAMMDMMVASGADAFPLSYSGCLLDSLHSTRSMRDRKTVLHKAMEAVRWMSAQNEIEVPQTLELSTPESVVDAAGVLGFPVVCKTEKELFLCRNVDELSLVYVTCLEHGQAVIAQQWVQTRAVLKVEVIGDDVTLCWRKTVTVESCGDCTTPAPRTSAKVPDSNWMKTIADIQPNTALIRKYVQTLRFGLGVHLFNLDLLVIEEVTGLLRYAVVDVNHFPGYKDVPDVGSKMRVLIRQALRWSRKMPKTIVVLGNSDAVYDVGIELAERLHYPVELRYASLPSDIDRVMWPYGITAVKTWLHPSMYVVRSAAALFTTYVSADDEGIQATHEAISNGVLERCKLEEALTYLPSDIAACFQAYVDGSVLYSTAVEQLALLSSVASATVPVVADFTLDNSLRVVSECWKNILSGSYMTCGNRPPPFFSFPHRLPENRAFDTKASRSSSVWNAMETLKRCSSGDPNEREFIVIETSACYHRFIAPRLHRERLPNFLAEMVSLSRPGYYHPHAHCRVSACGRPLFKCIDTVYGGWLLSPNPKYCDPLRVFSLEEAKHIPFIAYWISPVWYGEAFKRKVARVACGRLSHYDINQQAAKSTLQKPPRNIYYHTFRDVADVRVFQSLREEASIFFHETFGTSLDDLMVDMHYLPQVLYSTLHVHFRKPKRFPSTERPCRFNLRDMINKVSYAPIETWKFMYIARFNSFHGIWQLITESVMPVEVLNFGPCMANRVPIFLVGVDRNKAKVADVKSIVAASETDGFIPSDMFCDELPTTPDATNAKFASANIEVPEMSLMNLCSGTDVDWMYIFESPDCYSGIRHFYRSQRLPVFLCNIISGTNCEQEVRYSLEGTPLYCTIPNSDGSGWFLCLNAKYHPPTISMSLVGEALQDLNFVAWWIHPTWWPNVAKLQSAGEIKYNISKWNTIENVKPSAIGTAHLDNYLYCIRDCKSPNILENLLSTSTEYFRSVGIPSLAAFEVLDAHYPPSHKYATLHVHFRSRRSFDSNQFTMRFPVQAVIKQLRDDPDALSNGKIRYFYPHHSGRAVWSAAAEGFVSAKLIQYGARTPSTYAHHYFVTANAQGELAPCDDLVAEKESKDTATMESERLSIFTPLLESIGSNQLSQLPFNISADISLAVTNRVGGKDGMLTDKTNHVIYKPIFGFLKSTEPEFYKQVFGRFDICPQPAEFMPKYYGEVHDHPIVGSVHLHEHQTRSFLVLEDVTASYAEPCVMDIKIGKQTHAPDASVIKASIEAKKGLHHTDNGYRITGMRIFDESGAVDLKRDDIYAMCSFSNEKALAMFLKNAPVGQKNVIVRHILHRICEMETYFEKQKEFRFYGSSLLFVYGRHRAVGLIPPSTAIDCSVHLIDAAHVWSVKTGKRLRHEDEDGLNNVSREAQNLEIEEVDENFLCGLRNLKRDWSLAQHYISTSDDPI